MTINGFRVNKKTDGDFKYYVIADNFGTTRDTAPIEKWGTIHIRRFLTIRERDEFLVRLADGTEVLP